ncbi:hypothetical protein HMPREF0078_0908 [Anaerococcus vaginalis ATCC 51170]|uniref:Uncharacterized protein n=1 Tax=Anaerococcus vaginalis ATCC 51170 TaxID=655811 RepID=C7HUF7_9FIRM|nr:hypothetical protein HMPREF0078_0908 [Anaerococcus vaginalis ATCC 51170]
MPIFNFKILNFIIFTLLNKFISFFVYPILIKRLLKNKFISFFISLFLNFYY